MKRPTLPVRVFRFYLEGFKSMTLGRRLWVIILVKLFVMFAIFRLFFFRDFLEERFHTDQQKSEYVIEQLTNTDPND